MTTYRVVRSKAWRNATVVAGAVCLLGAFTLIGADCYKINAWCKVDGAYSATRAFSDSARTMKAWIYCKTGGTYYQSCENSGSYDEVFYKNNNTYGSCIESLGWVTGGSGGPTHKKVVDNDCDNSGT